MNKNGNENNLRRLLGFERLRIDITMNQIAASLNPKIRKSIMRDLREDLKTLIGEPGDAVVSDETGVDIIVNTLQIGGQFYAINRRQPKSFVMNMGVGWSFDTNFVLFAISDSEFQH